MKKVNVVIFKGFRAGVGGLEHFPIFFFFIHTNIEAREEIVGCSCRVASICEQIEIKL